MRTNIIYIDTREASRQEKIVKGLEALGIKVEEKYLDYGDYFVPGEKRSFLVERKTIFDLLKSWRDGRIFDQLKGLKSVKDAELIIILEGSPALPCKRQKWSRRSVAGILNSILFDYKIPYVFSPSPAWTVINLQSLCKIAGGVKKKRHKLVFEKVPESPDEIVLRIVSTFPQVGPAYAERLLEKFSSIEGICKASVEDLASISGISKRRAAIIWLTIRHQYKHQQKRTGQSL